MHTSYETAIDAALSHLQEGLGVVNLEIKDYPGPISGCDAQFNKLLSDRAAMLQALDVLQNTPFVPTPRSPEPRFALESR